MMTADERIRATIGSLVIENSNLTSLVVELQEQVARLVPSPSQEPVADLCKVTPI